ncbi:MAG: hypothetical protein J7L23_00985 [Candidatus Diapherotrites archaeon]|nr:hypothetical protein [Candidatus Diapherotrites archaeon]
MAGRRVKRTRTERFEKGIVNVGKRLIGKERIKAIPNKTIDKVEKEKGLGSLWMTMVDSNTLHEQFRVLGKHKSKVGHNELVTIIKLLLRKSTIRPDHIEKVMKIHGHENTKIREAFKDDKIQGLLNKRGWSKVGRKWVNIGEMIQIKKKEDKDEWYQPHR